MSKASLITQRTNAPTPKVAAAGASGLVAYIVTWVADTTGFELPERLSNAVVLGAALVAGYLKRERKPRGDTPGTNGIADHRA